MREVVVVLLLTRAMYVISGPGPIVLTHSRGRSEQSISDLTCEGHDRSERQVLAVYGTMLRGEQRWTADRWKTNTTGIEVNMDMSSVVELVQQHSRVVYKPLRSYL